MRTALAAAVVSILLAAGCGSSSRAPVPQTETLFEGTATKGPLDGGTLRIDDERGDSHDFAIGSDSRFNGSVLGDGSFTCRVFGGTFTDESTGLGQTIALQFALFAIFFAQPESRVDLNVSVLTTLVFWRMQFLLAARPGLPPRDAYGLACENYGLLGFGRGNPLPAPTLGDALRAWLLAAALSQMAAAQGVPTAELVHWFALDGMDGRFDGVACGKRIQLSNGTYPVDAMIAYKNNLLNFLETNPNNTTGLASSDPFIVALCDAIDAHLDGGTCVLDDPPVVQSVYPDTGTTAGGDTVKIIGQFDGGPVTTTWRHTDGTSSVVPGIVYDASSLGLLAPPGPLGNAWVEVKQESTGLYDLFRFRYTSASAPVTVTRIEPSGGPLLGGTLVKVTGSGFRMGSPPPVTMGGQPASLYRVASDTCLYVFAPEGAAPGSVPVVVGAAGGLAYQYRDPFVPGAQTPPGFWDGATRFADLGSDGLGQCGVRRVDFATGAHAGSEAEFDFGTGQASAEATSGTLTPEERRVLFDDGSTFEVATVDEVLPGGPGGPARRVGLRVATPTSTVAPLLDGDYFVVGLCMGAGGNGTIQGKASFRRTRGKCLVLGLISTPTNDVEGDAVNPLLAAVDFAVAANGRLTLSGFDPASGITLADGFVSPDGGHGMAILAGADAIYSLLFGRCPSGIADHGAIGLGGGAFEVMEPGVNVVKANHLVGHREGLHQRWRCDMNCRLNPLDPNPPPKFEFLIEDGFFVDSFGVLTSKKGRKIGFLTEGGVVLSLPGLPFWGVDDDFTFGADMGFGAWAPIPPYFTSKSIRDDYKTLATGIELAAPANGSPNPFERTTQILGCARPKPSDVVLVCEEPFALATKFEFDVLKDKRVTRDESRNVSTVLATPSTLSGFAYTFIGNTLIAVPCPFGTQTICIFKGGVTAGGEIVTLTNAEGIEESWCAALVRKSTVAPPVTGNYDLRFLLTQAQVATGDLFAAQGPGSIAFGSGTYQMSYTQFSVREDLFSDFPTGPNVIPGTFVVDSEGCIDMVQDFGGGFTAPLCGIVSRNGGAIFLMGPGPGPLSTTYALMRTDAVAGQVPFAGTQPLCGLELDFLGGGVMTAATRTGMLVTRASSLDLTLDRVVRTNTAAGFTRVREELLGLTGTFVGRNYSVTAPGPRLVEGVIGTLRPGAGSHIDRRAETSLDVSTR